jgi:penicillin-binding protein 2
MRNRPFIDHSPSAPDDPPRLDGVPQLRLLVLFVAIALPVLVIAGRLAWLQVVIPDRFLAGWDRTFESEEPVASRDGRILTADGRVLAEDEVRFDVAVHYRWLEDPPDERWLKARALEQLKPRNRRDPQRIADARQRVLQQRAGLWHSLAALTGRPAADLNARRQEVQRRIERIYATVTERQEQRAAERDEAARQDATSNPRNGWHNAWDVVVRELTTPPERPQREPLIIKEQLDYHVLIEGVSLDMVASIESLPSRFPGVAVRQSSRRRYPGADVAAHIVGIRTPLTGDEFNSRSRQFPGGDPFGYEVGDPIGRSGIERAYDAEIHGRRGLRRIVRNRHGEILHSEMLRPPVRGADVVLACHSRLQQQAESLLDAAIAGDADAGSAPLSAEQLAQSGEPPAAPRPQGGCLVALDVRTGRVLAAAAAPRFDLRLLVDHDPQEWDAVVNDPREPFFPRMTQMTVPPGSVFKTLTAIALLESGRIDPDAPVHCRGYLDEPDRDRCLIYRHYGVGHGDMDLAAALCQSCNVYFFTAARILGPQPIHDWAARFGLGRTTGIDVPGERSGNLPSPERRSGAEPWHPGTTLQLSIGQGKLTTTPLQVARMMAAVANDGYLVTPRFVIDRPQTAPPLESATGVTLAAFESFDDASAPVERIPGLSPATLARVREGLRMVVEHPRGTGRTVRMDEISIAGKTGTAEVGGGRPDHAWFAGYAPAEQPRVAFVVVLEHGGSGGRAAAPLARRFVQAMLDTGTLPRR